MTEADALSLIQAQEVGRLSIDVDGYPVALPVNYAVELRSRSEPRIVIRTAPQSTIGSYHGPASLEVDQIDLRHGTAWSVLVRGDFGRVRGRRPAVDPDPFISDGRTRWMQLVVRAVDGRRFAGDVPAFTTGRVRLDDADEIGPEPSAPWLDRTVTAAADAVRVQIARLRSVVAPPGSTD